MPGYCIARALRFRGALVTVVSLYSHPLVYDTILKALLAYFIDHPYLISYDRTSPPGLVEQVRLTHVQSPSLTYISGEVQSYLDGFLVSNHFEEQIGKIAPFWPHKFYKGHAAVRMKIKPRKPLLVDTPTVKQAFIPADTFSETMPGGSAIEDSLPTPPHLLLLRQQVKSVGLDPPVTSSPCMPLRTHNALRLQSLKALAHCWYNTIITCGLRPLHINSAIRYFRKKLHVRSCLVHIKVEWIKLASKYTRVPEVFFFFLSISGPGRKRCALPRGRDSLQARVGKRTLQSTSSKH